MGKKLIQKRPNQKNRKVPWTSIQYLRKYSNSCWRATPQWRWRRGRQPAWRCFAR